ncbi:MAG: FecR family protein [Candidatus Riflebacteria bacterium]|nr:FecR family protein [Candidatus Riflebacteria bacterium]
MKRIGLLLFAVLFLISPCFAREGQDSGIRFSDLFGEVSVRPNAEDDDAYEFAELDMPLYVNDRIRTKEESGAILSMADMSTFVVKPESIVVLNTTSGKENKIELLAGNIWVNVKKMVSDGTMEVEMSQAVAGIKGTNITCSTRSGEDRIQVLRGHAEVLIKESKETVEVQEGEELIVKSGGKTEKVEIDVQNEQKKWEEQTSRMGELIQLNEIPEILKGILDAETSEFARINGAFGKLIALVSVDEAAAVEIKRDAERFVGVIMEDNLILSSIRKKVEVALQTPDITAADRVLLANHMKNIAAVMARQQGFQTEIAKILRYQFKLTAIIEDIVDPLATDGTLASAAQLVEDISGTIEQLRTELTQVTSEVDSVRAVLSSNANGQSQDWFKESISVCADALADLDALTQKVTDLLNENPTSLELQALLKSLSDQRNSIGVTIKSLTVVEVSSDVITEMSQLDDVLSDRMIALQNEIAFYQTITESDIRLNTAAMERRLVASAKIIDGYARVRRYYSNAQRLYNNTMRAAASSKYKTAEQEEVENTWQNISDRFQQLGSIANELQSNISDLESQLSTFLK